MALFGTRVLAALLVLPSMVATSNADDWRSAAKKEKLSAGQIRQLAEDKILITDKSYLQIFSPYVEPRMPVFITSDSILNAYHVLLEESILRLEHANARKLPEILKSIWTRLETVDQGLTGKPAMAAAAKARAQIVVGTALGLLGEDAVPPDAEIAAVIDAEVRRVTAATGRHKPEWLGPQRDAELIELDYSRYKPRGFYANLDALANYFRAVSWLQSIPFRVDEDEELLAILMLGNCIAGDRFGGDGTEREAYETFFACFREFLGDRDDWDLMTAAGEAPDPWKLNLDGDDLDTLRRSLKDNAEQRGHRPLVNDQIAFPAEDPAGPIPLSFRVISAYRTPDAVLFQRTTDPRKYARPFPSGLEVCIALGSSYAETRLEDPQKEEVLATIERSQDLFSGSSLYCDYLHCLSALLDEPDANAPAFMSAEPWQMKSCQTTLAGWAQLRHTWTLQAKQTVVWMCATEPEHPVGFVEPDPEFFRRLEDVAEKTATLLSQTETAMDGRSYAIVQLQNLLRVLEAKAASGDELDEYNTRSVQEIFAYDTLRTVMNIREVKISGDHAKEFLAEAIPTVKKTIEQIQRGELSGDEYVGWVSGSLQEDVEKLWRDLSAIAGRLRGLADKQLRGVAFAPEEREFILDYGKALAPLMFHTGDASETPRDDVPRIVDVVHNPAEGEYLEVGIGRPRLMYVLYPVADGEVLCRGAVLPYYEFRHPQRLNDAEWRDLLDSADGPDPPAWMDSLVGPGSLQKSARWERSFETAIWVGGIALLLGIPAGWIAMRLRHRQRAQAASQIPQE